MNGCDDETWKKLVQSFDRTLVGVAIEDALRPLGEGEGQPPFICGAFSPDGTMIALSGGGRIPSHPAIWVARVPTFETVAALHGHQGVHDLAWDPKTGLLASASNDYCVVCWDVPRGDHLFVYGGDDEPIVKGSVAFGDGVLYIGESEPFLEHAARLLRVDLATGDVETVFELERDGGNRLAIDFVAVDPATDAWAFAADDFDYFERPMLVRGRGLTAGKVEKLERHARALGLHRDEALVAFDREADEGRGAFAFAPDGARIEALGGEVRTPAWTTKLDTAKDFSLVACSPDGTRLVVAGFDVLALLDGRTGEVLARATPPAWFRP